MREATIALLAAARQTPFTQEDRDAHTLDFAWGNLAIERPDLTHEEIIEAFKRVYGRDPLALPRGWKTTDTVPSKPERTKTVVIKDGSNKER